MPIFFQQDVDQFTKLAIWKIEEGEAFFLNEVPLQREITHPHKRLQHLAGRYLLKYLFPDFPTGLIRIADTRKPFLENDAYHFSISHCGEYAAVIVSSSSRVGIDIEITQQKVWKIRHKFLHENEYPMISSSLLPPLTAVSILWSAKEAMFKWWAKGGVDFSDMLRLSGKLELVEATLDGEFIKDDTKNKFPVHYRLFANMVLAWVVTGP